jgi:hypothetical protein
MNTISISILDYDHIASILSIQRDGVIHFDLSRLEFVKPDGIVLFTLLLRQLQLNENRVIKLFLPNINEEGPCPLSYLKRIHFFDKLHTATIFNEEDQHKLEQLRHRYEHQSTQFTKIIDKFDTGLQRYRLHEIVQVFVGFLKEAKSINLNEAQFLNDLLNETFLNLIDHGNPEADEPPYYCAQIQCYPRRQGMTLALGDSGIGIKASLNLAHHFGSDMEALKAVIEKKASRFAAMNTERGGGIRRIFSLASHLRIHCRLRSGGAEALLRNDGRTFSFTNSFPFLGTQIFLWK